MPVTFKTRILAASSPEVKTTPSSKMLVDYLAIISRKIILQAADYFLQIQLNRIMPEVGSLASQNKSNLVEVFSAVELIKEVVYLDNPTSQLKVEACLIIAKMFQQVADSLLIKAISQLEVVSSATSSRIPWERLLP